MFFAAKKEYGKWLLGLIALALLLWALTVYRAWFARSRFVERLYTGYGKNVSLVPILAPLELRANEAMALDIAMIARTKQARLLRILKGIETAEDRASVAGSNWMQAAWADDYAGTTLGAKAWKKVSCRTMDKADDSREACAERLRDWPPALLHFNKAHVFEKKFMAWAVKQVERDAARVKKALPQMKPEARLRSAGALFEAGVLFHDLPASRSWRTAAEEVLRDCLAARQKPDGSIDGSLEETMTVIEIIVPALAMGYRAGIPLSGELASPVQRLLEILMYSLDMNGCLPFAPSEEAQANKREWLFWGSRIFQRPDFAWVAYGGLDALEVRPPREISRSFPDMGLYVMRNNWEIRRFLYRGQTPGAAPLVSDMSHTMWIDTRRGAIELFACGERQLRLVLPAPVQMPDWRVGEQGVVLQGTLGTDRLTVVHLVSADAWIVRVEGLTNEPGIKIVSLRFPFRETAEGMGMVTCPIRPSVPWDWSTGLRMKPFGAVCLRTDGQIVKEDEKGFSARSAGKSDALTLVIAGAFRMKSRDIDKTAESRRVAITADGCALDAREPAESRDDSSCPWQPLRLSFENSQVMLNDDPL